MNNGFINVIFFYKYFLALKNLQCISNCYTGSTQVQAKYFYFIMILSNWKYTLLDVMNFILFFLMNFILNLININLTNVASCILKYICFITYHVSLFVFRKTKIVLSIGIIEFHSQYKIEKSSISHVVKSRLSLLNSGKVR